MFSLFEAFFFPLSIISEGDLLLRGTSLGMPLVKEFYSVNAGRVRIGSFLHFQCVFRKAFCCPLR